MKILWISTLPAAVEQLVVGDGASRSPAVSWILGHLPPPPEIELHIATLWPGASHYREVEYSGAKFHLIPCQRTGRASLLFARDTSLFRPLFKRLSPHVVHGWGTEDSFGLVARRLAPHRHVVGIQGLITEYRKRIAMPRRTLLTQLTEQWTLRRAKYVVAESNYSLKAARPLCPQACMREIEHPLRDEFLTDQVADGSATQVLYVGNLDQRKGIWDALEAFAFAAAPSWTLKVVSSGSGDGEPTLFARANELGIVARLVCQRNLGPNELVDVMRASSVFLLPTRIDTGPTALKEALAMGLWPVCYDNSGPREYIRMFQFGSLPKDLDRADLGRQLSEALETRPWQNPVRRAELFRRTRYRFAKREVWSQLQSLYEEIAGYGV